MDGKQRALVEALLRKQLPGLFANVQSSTEPPRREPFAERVANSPQPASVMNAFTNAGKQIAEDTRSFVTLPGDVWRGRYYLPPTGTPGITEDDGYNVYRDGEYIGNRLLNEQEYFNRTLGLASNVTGSTIAATAIRGPITVTSNVLGMGGKSRRNKPGGRGNKSLLPKDEPAAPGQTQDLGSPKLNSRAQRQAAREVKWTENIPISRSFVSQTSARNFDYVPLGRQQTYKDANGQPKSIQRADDLEGEHKGILQIEGGSVRTDPYNPHILQVDKYGRPKLKNSKTRRNIFD